MKIIITESQYKLIVEEEEYFEQLKQALILLKKPYPEVVHYSFVLLYLGIKNVNNFITHVAKKPIL